MREFLGIYKTSQTIHDELANNASKLAEINERIKKDSKNLKKLKIILLTLKNKTAV